MCLFFVRFHVAAKTCVRHVFESIFRDLVFADEENGVGSCYSALGESLCKSAKFVGRGFVPDFAVLLAAHELAVVEVLPSVVVSGELDAFTLFLLSELHVSLMR